MYQNLSLIFQNQAIASESESEAKSSHSKAITPIEPKVDNSSPAQQKSRRETNYRSS
ncbi:MAG: hypothetical protein SAJ37_04020 [Oscillatoria sp. PMC 1068.18]|nr:hypothetical protein [Oscillatoria sp. PMC 1076.18]MEC4987893.1 hypothetical protein [Oscillatoria sp. PMC 1068.18]